MDKYYLGLDMGTNSVGWAVTDEQYRLVRKKGKDLWGVRLFPEANTAQERRNNRCARRRRQREVARIGCLKELFAEAINDIDAGFFQRLEDSKFYLEDKRECQPFALFNDLNFTDKEYYKKYPTIYHLRKELLESREPHDVRLVYLAILNMFKHRGHFLNNMFAEEGMASLQSLYEKLKNEMTENYNIELAEIPSYEKLEEILIDKKYSKSVRVEMVRTFLNLDKKDRTQNEMWKIICGLQGTLEIIFGQEVLPLEDAKNKLSFDDANYEEKMIEIEQILPEEVLDILTVLKQIHDWMMLASIMKSDNTRGKTFTYLSQARVSSYEKHKEDLGRLKRVYKAYAPDKYDAMFRMMEDNNYSAYVGSLNVNGQIKRRGAKYKYEDFLKRLKRDILTFEQTEDTSYILSEIEQGTFLPKQMTDSNGVIPNQVHLMELKAILNNAETYLEFLKKKDNTGLSVSEKIVQLFQFQVPYFVGPLINTPNNNAWIVRREYGRICPWNFEQKVDVKKTAEQFIFNLVNHCTYLTGEQVLPKNSLLYEKFMVLNEINNLKINGVKITPELKQELFNALFKKGKKVTAKKIKEYLICQGYLSANIPMEISGIDEECINRLANYRKFLEIFEVESLSYEQEKIAEKIILWSTLYGDSKKFLREKIEDEYGTIFTAEQKKRILGYKFRDWGRLSKEFLTLEGADKESGEVQSIISRLWNENYNLMQLLSDDFTYRQEVERKTSCAEKTLSEIEYEDLRDLYASAPVRRMTWQTILIMKEIYKVIGRYPDKVFVEMSREHENNKRRTVSRKKKFEELYKECTEERNQWLQQIEATDETQFRSKKLYLYYTQKGRCMYTGEKIDISKLFNDNIYDIDHIYPRHYVKDDNIDNNLVLVKKQINAHKRDIFPIEPSIQQHQMDMWNLLLDKGFITKEKYKRLTRKDEFTLEEQAGFISRQMVETRQGTKMIADILQASCKDAELVYVKAGNVSDFRHKYDLIKCRGINDFHHAHDAYLNIVVGNVYYTKFTKSPINFVKAYRENPEKNKYHMDKLFDFDVKRGNMVAWEANKSISVVKQVIKKNTPLITYMNFEVHGGLADQTIYSAAMAAKAKGEGYIPLKSSDTRLVDAQKYGGFRKFTGTFFFAVEYTLKGKRVRVIETLPLYLKEQLTSTDKLLEYSRDTLGYENPRIICKKIKMYSLMKINGYYGYISGRTGNQILIVNAVQLMLDYEWQVYVKRLDNLLERNVGNNDLKQDDIISKEKNERLYHILLDKHCNTILAKKPNSLGKKLQDWETSFGELTVLQQIIVLGEIIKLSQRANNGVDMSFLGGSSKMGISLINKKISGLSECKVISQSATGLYVAEKDLLVL